MNPLTVFGEFPPVLYRISDERWAYELAKRGRLRLSRVNYFVNIEDGVRVDKSEGTAHQLIPGDVHKVSISPDGEITSVHTELGLVNLQIESVTPTYIMCLSYPPDGDITKLPWKFGSTAVRITDPQRFAQDITDRLTHEGQLRGTPVVECRKVRYDKGEPSDDLSDNIERARLSFSQKPRSYEREYEYRFAVLADLFAVQRNEVDVHHCVDLGGPLSYAEVIRGPTSHRE